MATITGILTNDDGTKKRISLRIESPTLLHAIEHGRGEVDQVMTDLLATMLGNYEDAMGQPTTRIDSVSMQTIPSRKL